MANVRALGRSDRMRCVKFAAGRRRTAARKERRRVLRGPYRLFDLPAQGKIEPVIAERMPLAKAARRHELVERAAVRGKIVLMVNDRK